MSDRFLVSILSKEDPTGHSSMGAVFYKGSDYQEANRIAQNLRKTPEHKGKMLRFVDYVMFGGGLKDVVIR